MDKDDSPAVSNGVEDRPFGLQHRLGYLIWLWRDLVSFPGGEGVDGCVKLP